MRVGSKGLLDNVLDNLLQDPICHATVNELMGSVTEAARKSEELRRRLFGANFQCTLSGEAMVGGHVTSSVVPSPHTIAHPPLLCCR